MPLVFLDCYVLGDLGLRSAIFEPPIFWSRGFKSVASQFYNGGTEESGMNLQIGVEFFQLSVIPRMALIERRGNHSLCQDRKLGHSGLNLSFESIWG